MHELRQRGEAVSNRYSMMTSFPLQPAFSHLGLYVIDLTVMEEFYCKILGFYVTDRLGNDDQEMIFLSRSLQEHHQIVLEPGRSKTAVSTINQISFEIGSLNDLSDAYQGLISKGIRGMKSMNHGGSWSLYVPDPEKNMIELFVRTNWYVPPHATTTLDLNHSEMDIIEQTKLLVNRTPGSMTWDHWRQDFQAKMSHPQ